VVWGAPALHTMTADATFGTRVTSARRVRPPSSQLAVVASSNRTLKTEPFFREGFCRALRPALKRLLVDGVGLSWWWLWVRGRDCPGSRCLRK
jgi:hypothetical protein